jgi:hypothetical protein
VFFWTGFLNLIKISFCGLWSLTCSTYLRKTTENHYCTDSVADPDPNPDPHVFGPPDPLVRGMDPDPDPSLDPDPSIIMQK